jgi:hypothetical protein
VERRKEVNGTCAERGELSPRVTPETDRERRIERATKRIALARKAARRGTRPDQTEIEVEMATRRAYQEALRALDAIPSDISASEVARLAAEELDRVKSALARIYEIARRSNHDIADAEDWAIVEGEAQAALNVVHEAEKDRSTRQ